MLFLLFSKFGTNMGGGLKGVTTVSEDGRVGHTVIIAQITILISNHKARFGLLRIYMYGQVLKA